MYWVSRRVIRNILTVFKLIMTVSSVALSLVLMESLLNHYITLKLQHQYRFIANRDMTYDSQRFAETGLQSGNNHVVKREVRMECPDLPEPGASLQNADDNVKPNARQKRFKQNTDYLLVLFTTFERNKVREVVYNNTKTNWLLFGKKVKTVLFSNDESLQKEFKVAGWTVSPIPKVSKYGLPILKYMYITVRQKLKAVFYAFTNADIIFTEDLLDTLESIASYNLQGHLYVTGQRTDLTNITRKEGKSFKNLRKTAIKNGTLHIPFAEDYFITDEKFPWDRIPDLVIARQYYDNWMSFNARRKKYWAVDATGTILAVHQKVDKGCFQKRVLSDEGNRLYNYKLINKIMKREPNYEAGLTTCLDYYSARTVLNETVLIKRQKLPEYCNLNGKRPYRIKHY